MTTTNTYGRQIVVPLANKSGGGVIAGDVVIIDTSNNDAFTTTTSAGFQGGVGIAQEAIASNATGRVLTAGYAALVNTTASVTRGNFGTTSTTVKKAVDSGSSRAAGSFVQFLTGGTTPDGNVFNPDPSAAAGNVATDAIWDTVGDIAVGTGANTAAVGRGYVLLSETVLGSDQSSITFTGISGAYRDLIVSCILRSAIAAAADDFRIRVGNGSIDTGTNYSYQTILGGNASASGQNGSTQATVYLGAGMGSTGLANSWSFHEMTIRNYASTTKFKPMLGTATALQNSTASTVHVLGGVWRSTSAIDQVRVFADGGNLLTGSIVTLYGRG